MDTARQQRLSEFVDWTAKHIRGDEKGEAHVFLDRLFQAFGQPGTLDVGGQPEYRIRKSQDDGGGTAFADYVWKPVVLIEMKKRGQNLAKHYRQAFDYWVRLAPNRPKYVVLCNFDELWVYDFDSAQIDTPVDMVALKDLPERWGPLAFLFPTNEKPVFGNDHEAVTREAADLLAACFNKLISRKIDRPLAQRFILQMLVSLFADDIGLLEKYTVTQLLLDCKSPQDSYDILGGLFVEMNTPGRTRGGRYKGVNYFNGGLFADPARIELAADELSLLQKAANSDWSKVRPEIFGTLFEHSLQKGERHAFGAHFTSPVDIMKIIGPTITQPWQRAIDAAAKSPLKLRKLQEQLQHFRVLDPACGSGNFLYMAYRELKRIEAQLVERLNQFPKSKADAGQKTFGFVTASQFYGLDINPFAIELAKVTMMIARKLAIDELHVTEPALPLDNLDANFIAGDSLIDANGNPTVWPAADVIIGNPPFLGAKRLKPEHGSDYVNAVRRAYPDVPGMADYCVYWFRKAHDRLPACTVKSPLVGRAGLVGTQNIRNNQSRVGGLDHIAATGTIIEAVDNQPWSGEANVHVSIANWMKTQDAELVPEKRRLWVKQPSAVVKKARKRGTGSAGKEYELDYRDAAQINSALSDRIDLSRVVALACNTDPQCCFQGIVTGYNGFVLSLSERQKLIKAERRLANVVRPYLIGRDLVSGDGHPSRAVIDFADRDQFEARSYAGVFRILEQKVLPMVEATAKKSASSDMAEARQQHLERWWQFWNVRTSLRAAIGRRSRYIALSRVTKRQIFCFVSTEIVPDGKLQVFAFADDYSFGIISSRPHWEWFIAKCAKLTERLSYSPRSVFDTFPWPQSPTAKQIEAVAKAGREVRRVRAEALTRITGGLRAVYRTLELPGANPLKVAHEALDAAVLAAYGFSAKKDLLAQLLDLNRSVADLISRGDPVIAPGIPPNYLHTDRLMTTDCISPPEK